MSRKIPQIYPRVVYHWWAHESDPHEHCKNLRSPIILSIATLRAKNPNIQIEVLDGTEGDPYLDPLIGDGHSTFNTRNPEQHYSTRWGDWPQKLKFNVWHNNFALANKYKGKAGYKHLSRLFDLYNAPDLFKRIDTDQHCVYPDSYEVSVVAGYDDSGYEVYQKQKPVIIYSDADVFWLKDPLPLDKASIQFCFDGWNSGFFYYTHKERSVEHFFEIFKAYTIGALNSQEIRNTMKKYVGYSDWYYVFDEMILSYMFNTHRSMFHQLNINEHCTARQIKNSDNLHILKMFHCNGSMFHNHLAKTPGEKEHCRGLLPLVWKELWDSLTKVMGDNDIIQIYTRQELDYYLPRQYEFKSPEGNLRVRKSGDGKHFYLHDTLKTSSIGMV